MSLNDQDLRAVRIRGHIVHTYNHKYYSISPIFMGGFIRGSHDVMVDSLQLSDAPYIVWQVEWYE
jgi:hypothetical protein